MSKQFRELYNSDIARYANRADRYICRLLYFFRKAQTTNFSIFQYYYRLRYRNMALKRGIEISWSTEIGKGLYLGHAYNITINPKAVIGQNCNIHKGVLIGQENRGVRKGTPVIGNRVWIGINSVIIGKVTIGDDVLIAPNSYVNCDVPSHSVVFGNPCIIKPRENATEQYINNCV